MGVIRIIDGHPHHRYRSRYSSDRHYARQATARSHNHLAAYFRAQNGIWRADVVGSLGRDRGSFDAETVLFQSGRSFVDNSIPGSSAIFQAQIKANWFNDETDNTGIEYPQSFLK